MTPELVGSWSNPIDLGAVAIHMALMHTNQLLYFSWIEGNPTVDHTSLNKTYDLPDGPSALAPTGYHRDLFCAGMNTLPDGRIFVSGGHDHNTGKRGDFKGWNGTDLYHPPTRTWTPGPQLSAKRWYPTSVSMPTGNTLIMGGGETQGDPSPTMESYDPVRNTMRTLPSTATKNIGLYPRMHLLPDGNLIKTGWARSSLFFRPATNTWHTGPAMTFGNRQVGNSVLLPGSRRILVCGGKPTASGPPTNTAEILDMTAATPAWRSTAPMKHARVHANAVLLPDGKVLVIGGGTSDLFVGPVKHAEMFDPATERWTELPAQSAQRMYHATAALLPDGRVISAGSDSGTLSKTAELYSPPYLFRGERPKITTASNEALKATYGGSISVTVTVQPDDPLSSLVLMRPGVVTHQIDTEQRSVPLAFKQATTGEYVATSPANAKEATPGYYMLFALSARGIPSVAVWVHLG